MHLLNVEPETLTKGIKETSFYLKKLFLSKAEREYLTSKQRFSTGYAYTIKSRLQKKLEQFSKQELPLLVEQGYLTEFCKLPQPNLTENCKVSKNYAVQEETEKTIRSDVNIISNTGEELRGSPSPAVRTGGNLVGRGIANPMSERTRGFEIPKGKC